MSKSKTVFYCRECGAQFPKWLGQCSECNAWNSLQEEIFTPVSHTVKPRGYTGGSDARIQLLNQVDVDVAPRLTTGIHELDRVLGGGLVNGSIVLLGGDPGIGKSTLLLQALCRVQQQHSTLYVSGEESLQQIAARAKRLELPADNMPLLAETQVETIIAHLQKQKARVVVIDSVQTIFTDLLQSAPGAVAQVREATAQLVRYAKQSNTTILLVGHVTKEGALAGPRVLEHMVDTVLYFEGEASNRFRCIRAVKNRFGAVNELGIFAMTEKGVAGSE
jgi:DNA repair protein RadA/Sms